MPAGYRYALVRTAGLTNGKTITWDAGLQRFVPAVYGGSGGPDGGPEATDLIPLPLARQVPWSGWMQFTGLPLNTMSMGPLSMTMAYGSAPVYGQLAGPSSAGSDDTIYAAVIGTDANIRFRSVLVAIPMNGTPSGADWKVTVSAVTFDIDNPEAEPALMELAEFPIEESPFITSPALNEIYDFLNLATNDVSLGVVLENKVVLQFILEMKNVATDLPPAPEDNMGLGIVRFSMYESVDEQDPVTDPSYPGSFGGMMNPVVSHIRSLRPTAAWMYDLTPEQMTWGHLDSVDDSFVIDADVNLVPEYDGPDAAFLRIERLRVTDAPVGNDDVVRKEDLDAATGGATYRFVHATSMGSWTNPASGTVTLDARNGEHGIAPGPLDDVVVEFSGLNNFEAARTVVNVYNAYTGPGDEFGTVTFIDQTSDRYNGNGAPNAIPTGRARQIPLTVWRDGTGTYHCRAGWGITLDPSDD